MPILPTTPLMILALWGFSNGSETLHNWLYNHPKFGPTLQDWDKYRVIPTKAKIASVSMISISAVIMVFFSGAPTWAVISAVLLMAYGAYYVLSQRSERPPEE